MVVFALIVQTGSSYLSCRFASLNNMSKELATFLFCEGEGNGVTDPILVESAIKFPIDSLSESFPSVSVDSINSFPTFSKAVKILFDTTRRNKAKAMDSVESYRD